MKNFKLYCGLTLLLIATSMFQPFLRYDFSDYSFMQTLSDTNFAPITEYTGVNYWPYFLLPIVLTAAILIISIWENLWTALTGVVLSFGIGLYTYILPYLIETGENIEYLAGYDYLWATTTLFFLLNISHVYQTAKNPPEKKITSNSDVIDDF